jgi:beta-barrel assembly-enhancing protease
MGAMAASAYADISNLPDLGDESTVVSPQQERKLGGDSIRQARQFLDFVDDPELKEYIQSLGNKLVAAGGAQPQDFNFFIVNDPTLNAFAVPGGFVVVNTGLVLAAQTEAELAAALAHETAHITQRHYYRMMAQSKRITGPAMAAIIASILLAGRQGQAGEAAFALTTAGLAQAQLSFTYANEQEADRIGIGILADAGFDPRAMPSFFERLQNWGRLNESSLPPFLRTHPITATRISESRDRAERYPRRSFQDSAEFYHAQAKLRAMGKGNINDIIAGFKQILEEGKSGNADAQHYGYALALARANKFDSARAEIAGLIQRHPANITYRLGQAEIESAAGNYDQALKIYATALKARPNYKPLVQRYAATLLETGHAQQAKDLLKTLLRTPSDDPALYKMLATAAGETGAKVEAHQALAESYYLDGLTSAAIEQLQIALRFAGDNFYIRSGLEARVKEIKEEAARWPTSSATK